VVRPGREEDEGGTAFYLYIFTLLSKSLGSLLFIKLIAK